MLFLDISKSYFLPVSSFF